jgi:very-short-patch-repair endonuclease
MKCKTKVCSKCNRQIAISQYKRHYDACNGIVKKTFIQEEWKTEEGKYKCPYCKKEYTKAGISSHIWRKHGEGKFFSPTPKGTPSKLKGKKLENIHDEERAKEIKEKISKSLTGKKYPNRNIIVSPETRKKISEAMKKAHAEGRAHNIGMSRWNNKPSYPETFLMKVIKDSFEDKNYIREYPISIYAADFAWVHKKIDVEIDGQQHKHKEHAERDKRKDKCLKERGWKVLRVEWIHLMNETQKWIKVIKDFVDNGEICNEHVDILKDETNRYIKQKMYCKLCNKVLKHKNKNNLCFICYKKTQRKVDRPPYEQLKKEIEETNYCVVGRKYGVSDNTIRKWIKFYKKHP